MQSPDRGKAKALRIRLDYYQQSSRFARARRLLTSLGLVVSLCYGIWILWSSTDSHGASGRSHVSRGPLAQVHAAFENDCDKCHAHGLAVALGKHSFQFEPDRRLDHQESTCQNCHRVDGHWRQSLQNSSLDRDCANCHREHTGRANRLTEVTNSACVECHRNLQQVCRSGMLKTDVLSTTDFSPSTHGVKLAGGEYQFRSLLVDRGRVKFDHAQHLQPGQVDAGRRGGMRLDMLPMSVRARLRMPGQADSELVSLACSSCHELSASKAEGRHVVSKEEGRYYAPINFEDHCQACHQMTFPGQTGQMLPLPHVTSPAEYELLLSARQSAFEVRSRTELSGQPHDEATKFTQVPSEADAAGTAPIGLLRPTQPERFAAASLSLKMESLRQRCLQCHVPEDVTPAAMELAMSGQIQPLIPSRWLINGYFDHATHSRIENCQFCHAIPGTGHADASLTKGTAVLPAKANSAESDNPLVKQVRASPPSDQEHVFIRGPESCVLCHRPSEAAQPAILDSPQKIQSLLGESHQPTWASDDCTLCHRYHWTRPEALSAQVEDRP